MFALTTFPAEENSEAKSASLVLKDKFPTKTLVRTIFSEIILKGEDERALNKFKELFFLFF
jgi:hypothetical protein